MASSLTREVSRQSSGGDEFAQELEFLQNVYFDELTYNSQLSDQAGHTLKFRVTPSTGDDKEKQYVYLVLNIFVPKEYPHVTPKCTIGQSRGLSDVHLRSIVEGMTHKCEELVGSQMIYELVEFAKDSLTDNNLPNGECAICLNGFQDTDEFKKTDCYHYFHLPCLARYLEYYQQQVKDELEELSKVDLMLRKKTRQLECPVCRVPMASTELKADPTHGWSTHSANDAKFIPSPELRRWQEDMKKLLEKQRLKGGIIDLSQSDVIDGSWVSTMSSNTNNDQPESESVQDSNTLPVLVKECSESKQRAQRKSKNGFKSKGDDSAPRKLENEKDGHFNSDQLRSRTRNSYFSNPKHKEKHRSERTIDASIKSVPAGADKPIDVSTSEHLPDSQPHKRRNRRVRGPQDLHVGSEKQNLKDGEKCSNFKQKTGRNCNMSGNGSTVGEKHSPISSQTGQ